MTKRGLFIVLEGPDGAGISTQTALLQSALAARGIRAIATKEPSSGPVGSLIRQALSRRLVYPPAEPIGDDVLALLYAADRLDHIRADILPRIESGVHVVCDRYVLSSYAYQGATLGQQWVRELNRRAIDPDITFFIDVPPEVSLGRVASRGGHTELYETLERLSLVYANYLNIIAEMKADGKRVVVVDGTPTPDVVSAEILRRTLELIGEEPRPET
jgi:dTMP kinase